MACDANGKSDPYVVVSVVGPEPEGASVKRSRALALHTTKPVATTMIKPGAFFSPAGHSRRHASRAGVAEPAKRG